MKHKKKIAGLVLALTVLFNSCKKCSTTPPVALTGSYKGIFQRTMEVAFIGDTVQIQFSGNTYTGSNPGTVELICHGTYQVTGDSINFHNDCVYPANTDMGGILTGKYLLIQHGDSLQFRRWISNFNPFSTFYYLIRH